MKTVLITGADGFIGKNLCSHLDLDERFSILKFTKKNSENDLEEFINKSDFIYHLAGVNRPDNDEEFIKQNTNLTKKILHILEKSNKKVPLLITSSTQASLDNPYGKSKLNAEKAVFGWHKESGSPVFVYRLPGVFGKWCRPNYNSVVATFCYNIVNNIPIKISDPSNIITLAYIDDVIKDFTKHLNEKNKISNYSKYQSINRTFEVSLKELGQRIKNIHNARNNLVVPNLEDTLNKFLYATYTSYLPKDGFLYHLTEHSDDRGTLAEFIKSKQFGQIFISKTKPGISRGDHWHHTKIEKFFVLEGDAEITFRNKISEQDIIRYKVSGHNLSVVDIPTGYVHAIKNIGTNDLITIFWANEILDKENPDTFYEKVE